LHRWKRTAQTTKTIYKFQRKYQTLLSRIIATGE
jgi:hypothetical protein